MSDSLTTAILRGARAALLLAALAGAISLGACAQANQGGFQDSGSESSGY